MAMISSTIEYIVYGVLAAIFVFTLRRSIFISTFPELEIDPVTPSKTAGSTTYCFFMVLKLTTELFFHPLGDFFKPCPSRAKAGFKKSPSG
jgi:hypothetical protein